MEALKSPTKDSKKVEEANTINSKTESSPPPKSSVKQSTRTDVPVEPPHTHTAFEKAPSKAEIVPPGNEEFFFSLRLAGKLGHFQARTANTVTPIIVPLSTITFAGGIRRTLSETMTRLLRNKGYQNLLEIQAQADQTVDQLVNGCIVMTYQKLRALHKLDISERSKFLTRPKVPSPFMVPTPFALAIQHLGVVKVSSLTYSRSYVPTFTEEQSVNYGLLSGNPWSIAAYNEAVEFAKSVGMQFSTVDTQVRLGSSWWLLEPNEDDEIFTLRCRLPEDNYTEQTAVIALLFCNTTDGGFLNPICDLSSLPEADYGSLVRDPPYGVHMNAYFGIEATSDQLWTVG
ncbi:TPA_asm: coat protein [Arceuthobium sichuanense virus 8]|nr:TPA_asm: coat protein [Arceuthobium sichuanense virus 8]